MPELTEVTEAKPEVKVEVESGSDSDSDDSVPELEDGINESASKVAQAAGLPDELTSRAKQSRGEKKARKSISKLGLKLVRPHTGSAAAGRGILRPRRPVEASFQFGKCCVFDEYF